MAAIAPTILWNWVIEALANSEQTDTRTLIGLMKMTPETSGDAGKDTREMVSFRILESLFSHDNEAIVNSDSAQKAKTSFSSSDRCEDVLKHILHEQTPEQITKLEEEKWNIRPFLMHKRSSLPKCSLKKLKEILESSHPLLASLKEKGNLVITNASDDTSPVIDNVQSTDDLALNPRKDKNEFQEYVLQEADQEHEMVIEKGNLVITNSSEDASPVIDDDVSPKKDINEFQENVLQESDQECEMVIEGPLEGSSGSKLIEHDEHNNNTQHDHHCNDDDLSPRKDKIEFQEHEMIIESPLEESNDEINYFAARKEAFLNSRLTLSPDLMSLSEIDICIKCNEGGDLLICNSAYCPFRVHESCLGFTVTVDEIKNFFCPFCAYSHAIPKLLEAKKNASRARKNLQAYSNFIPKRATNETSKEQCELEKNEGNGDINHMSNEEDYVVPDTLSPDVNDNIYVENETGEMNERNEDENNVIRDNDINHKSNEEDYVVPDNLIPLVNDDMNIETECLNQQTSELTLHPISKPSARKQKRKEKESQHRSIEASCSRSNRICKRKAQYLPLPAPVLRRTRLVWTKEEEEILKEGVARFPCVDHLGIPWKKILDFGCDVFQKGRTNIDLKDKWRNICGRHKK